jgi:hypothetical protein
MRNYEGVRGTPSEKEGRGITAEFFATSIIIAEICAVVKRKWRKSKEIRRKSEGFTGRRAAIPLPTHRIPATRGEGRRLHRRRGEDSKGGGNISGWGLVRGGDLRRCGVVFAWILSSFLLWGGTSQGVCGDSAPIICGRDERYAQIGESDP